MDIIGIERIVYGVTDLGACSRYLNDWGFTSRTDAGRLVFETAEKTCVEIRPHDDPSLPPLKHASAFFTGSCGREVIWGVASGDALEAIRQELAKDREVTADAQGTLHSSDGAGNPIGFCVTRRVPVVEPAADFNAVGAPRRIDKPADGAAKTLIARPLRINHVVYLAPTGEASRAGMRFYTERLGFRLSDNVGNNGFFMRAGASHDHHNLLFESHGPGYHGLQHSAYEFRDFDHIMHRGRYLETQGWESHNGPGRHTIGSNLTWYFWTPMGGLMELISDMDYLTDAWQPRFIDPKVAGRPIAWTSRPNGEGFQFGVPSR